MNSTLENQFNSELRAHFESAKTTQAKLFRLSLMADSVVGEAQKPGEFGPPFPHNVGDSEGSGANPLSIE